MWKNIERVEEITFFTKGTMMTKPIIGITMGDPAGIGPEIVVKALEEDSFYNQCKPLVIGDAKILEKVCNLLGSILKINTVHSPNDGQFQFGIIDLVDLNNVHMDQFAVGKVQAQCGKAAFQYIEKAAQMALTKELDAIATAPINKESLKAANVDYIGHTEILAGLTGTEDPLTMFEVNNLRVFFLSRHVSLIDACALVKKKRILKYIKRCTAALKQLGITEGPLAVAGLNPHCGEHGLFGHQEEDEIVPAIQEAKREGYSVEGPIGADSVFHLALEGNFIAVLSLYHDQGHIATKTLDFYRTISLTLGLPFLRTSVDHGTAFDKAWQGTAKPISMIEAIKLATQYSSMIRTCFLGG
jgi:4-hydroxythreonine-4-phosphate dehydrogenase